MKKDGDIIFHVPVPNSTNFQQKNHQKSFGNDFDNFCVNFPTEFEFYVSRQAEFSIHKLSMITHKISHHFCVDSR